MQKIFSNNIPNSSYIHVSLWFWYCYNLFNKGPIPKYFFFIPYFLASSSIAGDEKGEEVLLRITLSKEYTNR
jgi:hypothetical protein